jgi:hypothetical protein
MRISEESSWVSLNLLDMEASACINTVGEHTSGEGA